MILDFIGRMIKAGSRPERREIAYTRLQDRWSTYPTQGMTPETLASMLREADMGNVRRQMEIFEEMEEKDTHIFSELQTRKNAVLGLDYDVIPSSEATEDKKIAEFCGEILFGLPNFEDALLDLLDAIGKGFSLSEIIWDTDGRKAVISDLRWIHAKRAVFYDMSVGDRSAKSFEYPKVTTAAAPYRGEEIPPFKLVYHRYKARSGYDTRAGVLRVCAWMFLFKNYAIKDWAIFAEVFGIPFRLGKYDASATPQERTALMNAVRSIGHDGAGIVSKATEIEFVETAKGSGGTNVQELLASFANREISKAILGQTATTEGTPGKLGNEDAQDRVRQDLVKADAESLSKTVRSQILRPLVGYNFGWDKALPWFKMLYEPAEDLERLSNVYRNLHGINQPLSAEHVSERFKVPLPKEGETVLAPPSRIGLPLKDDGGRILIAAKDAFGGMTPDMESEMERKRQELVSGYFARLRESLGAPREDALREIEQLLLKSGPMSEMEFKNRVSALLRGAYGDISLDTVEKAIEPVYSFYRLSDKAAWGGNEAPVAISFDPVDRGTIEALAKIDRYYLSGFIENQDMQGPVMKFIQEKYLEQGEGLFGRGSEQAISAFRAQFSDKLAGIEEWQIRRVIDTSVTRMRSLGDLRQAVQANTDLRVYVTRGERACDICQPHHGEIVRAGSMETRMLTAAKDPEKFGMFNEVPPYHPNCVCRLLMDV